MRAASSLIPEKAPLIPFICTSGAIAAISIPGSANLEGQLKKALSVLTAKVEAEKP